MDCSNDLEVLRSSIEGISAGTAVTLVTVVHTWGSSPRRPGTLMAIHADGRIVGSVSGGCIEDDLVQRVLRGEFENQLPQLVEYGITHHATRRVGLPCGGRLGLIAEYINDATQLRKVLESIESRVQVIRSVCLTTGQSRLHTMRPGAALCFDGETLYKVFGPAWRMLIIGAGELARRVAQLALTLDYAVTICDSRPEYAAGWEVKGTLLVSSDAAEFMHEFAPDQQSVVLALAHAPPIEEQALAAALKTNAFYVGAIGSHKSQQSRLQRLRNAGITSKQLSRLHGPVGLHIGSRTPAEIAISITAELIAVRNLVSHELPQPNSNHG